MFDFHQSYLFQSSQGGKRWGVGESLCWWLSFGYTMLIFKDDNVTNYEYQKMGHDWFLCHLQAKTFSIYKVGWDSLCSSIRVRGRWMLILSNGVHEKCQHFWWTVMWWIQDFLVLGYYILRGTRRFIFVKLNLLILLSIMYVFSCFVFLLIHVIWKWNEAWIISCGVSSNLFDFTKIT